MIDNPIVFFLNTDGVILFVLFIIVLELIFKHKEVALHVTLSAITALIVSVILKELYSVPRPSSLPGVSAEAGLAYLYSFPSLHSALAFSSAITVALHQRKLGTFALVIAALMSVGRVAANVHYPIDIAFGMMIGVLVGMFFDNMHFKKVRLRRGKVY